MRTTNYYPNYNFNSNKPNLIYFYIFTTLSCRFRFAVCAWQTLVNCDQNECPKREGNATELHQRSGLRLKAEETILGCPGYIALNEGSVNGLQTLAQVEDGSTIQAMSQADNLAQDRVLENSTTLYIESILKHIE